MHASQEQMKKVDRLKKRSDFLSVQNSGKKWVSGSLVLQVADNPLPGPYQIHFGITVSRRLSKSAVTRNRAKRRLRALAYDILPVYARDNASYVLIGRQGTVSNSYVQMQKDLKWCLRKMGYALEKPGGAK